VWDLPALADLDRLSDAELSAALEGSAMQRAEVSGLRRNITVALENAS
jgi:epoxyqueuosine reductase QueG